MSADYHYSRDGQSFGPVSVEQLRQLAVAGQLTANDLVWKEGMAEWVPAGRFKGLIPPAPAANAPLAPGPAVRAAVAPSDDAATEFQLREAAPAPAMPQAAAFVRPAVKSEPIDDATQAEVFARQAKEVALAAGTDAWKAVKILATNPIGGLRTAFEALGPTRAMQVGIVFAILFDLSVVIFGHGMFSMVMSVFEAANSGTPSAPGIGTGIMNIIRLIFVGVAPFGAAIGGFAVARLKYKSQGGIQSDIFITGASLVPPTLVILVAWLLLHVTNVELFLAVAVFAMTTTILILYSGFTTIQGISEAAASLLVPLVLVFELYGCMIVLRILTW